jgi:hypothetical protein
MADDQNVNDARGVAEDLRDLAAEIRRDGLHGLPGPLPVDHFGRADNITGALETAAGLLEDLPA